MQKVGATLILILYIVCVVVALSVSTTAISHPLKYRDEIIECCTEYNIEPSTMCALINTESSFNPTAYSRAGAVGLTQLLPSTAQYICVKNGLEYADFDLYNARDSIYLGTMYLRYLLNKFSNIYTALSAYNAGETVVRGWLNNPNYSSDNINLHNIPYKETANYIQKIKENEKVYKKLYKL